MEVVAAPVVRQNSGRRYAWLRLYNIATARDKGKIVLERTGDSQLLKNACVAPIVPNCIKIVQGRIERK